MNEIQFSKRWEQEKPMYRAWGDFVLLQILNELKNDKVQVKSFFKNTPTVRVKDDKSLIDKAFYRKKTYTDPFNEIEDKVGLRFVVLLIKEIDTITKIIEHSNIWNFEKSRDFEAERNISPLLFTYQSVHYIVKPKSDINYSSFGITIKADISCEIQIRTILQHAYAELTHDSVYKAKTVVEPDIHRTIAKSMALIETTDDFFSDVNSKLYSNTYDRVSFQKDLDALYRKYIKPSYNDDPQKSSLVIMDEFKELIDSTTAHSIESFVKSVDINAIITNHDGLIYNQSILIFVMYLIKNRPRQLVINWPLDVKIIEDLATDLGVSLEQYR